MRPTSKVRFAHRLTPDQKFESICLRCFRTAGCAELEPGLEAAEKRHACLPEDVIVLHGKLGPETVGSEHQEEDLA